MIYKKFPEGVCYDADCFWVLSIIGNEIEYWKVRIKDVGVLELPIKQIGNRTGIINIDGSIFTVIKPEDKPEWEISRNLLIPEFFLVNLQGIPEVKIENPDFWISSTEAQKFFDGTEDILGIRSVYRFFLVWLLELLKQDNSLLENVENLALSWFYSIITQGNITGFCLEEFTRFAFRIGSVAMIEVLVTNFPEDIKSDLTLNWFKKFFSDTQFSNYYLYHNIPRAQQFARFLLFQKNLLDESDPRINQLLQSVLELNSN